MIKLLTAYGVVTVFTVALAFLKITQMISISWHAAALPFIIISGFFALFYAGLGVYLLGSFIIIFIINTF